MYALTNSCSTKSTATIRIRAINGRTTEFPAQLGKIIQSFVKCRRRDSIAIGNDIRAIMPTLKPTVKRSMSVNAMVVRIRSFVQMVRYSIRRDWFARGGTPWIALARKVSTPLTRRLQKQWRKLIGEHALCNELFKIRTYCAHRHSHAELHNRASLLISRGLNTKKCYGISRGVHAEIFHNKIRR